MSYIEWYKQKSNKKQMLQYLEIDIKSVLDKKLKKINK